MDSLQKLNEALKSKVKADSTEMACCRVLATLRCPGRVTLPSKSRAVAGGWGGNKQ